MGASIASSTSGCQAAEKAIPTGYFYHSTRFHKLKSSFTHFHIPEHFPEIISHPDPTLPLKSPSINTHPLSLSSTVPLTNQLTPRDTSIENMESNNSSPTHPTHSLNLQIYQCLPLTNSFMKTFPLFWHLLSLLKGNLKIYNSRKIRFLL